MLSNDLRPRLLSVSILLRATDSNELLSWTASALKGITLLPILSSLFFAHQWAFHLNQLSGGSLRHLKCYNVKFCLIILPGVSSLPICYDSPSLIQINTVVYIS